MSDTESNDNEESNTNVKKAKKVKLGEEEEEENVAGVQGMTDFLYLKPKSFSEPNGNAQGFFFFTLFLPLSSITFTKIQGYFGLP